MPAGTYRDLADIKTDASSEGASEAVYSGTLMANVPCKIEATSGNETYRGRQLEAHVDYVVEMHNIPGLKPDMRLNIVGGQYAGSVLNVTHVLPSVFRGRALTLDVYCKELVRL